MNSHDYITRQATKAYLATAKNNLHPERHMRAEGLYAMMDVFYQNENSKRPRSDRLRIPRALSPWQVAQIMIATEPIRRIHCVDDSTSENSYVVGIYQEYGPDAGTYDTRNTTLSGIIREYCHSFTETEINSVMQQLRETAPPVERCKDRDIIAVNNGLFNFRTKQLEPFDKDKVFLSKSHINYNPNAQPANIHNSADNTDWDVDSWIRELADDDPEVENCIWEILSAIVRPNVCWNKAAFFYSTTGNNGKGTLCVLMRNLVGASVCASIPLNDFGKDFMLEPLLGATCVIVDENDVGGYIDKAGNLKAVITGDTISINRKYKTPVYYQFHGMMVQCINEMPRIKDKSNSFYRRQLFVPFQRCFTGKERTYIKSDYLYRQEVLEYILNKVLHMTHYTLTTPKASISVMEEYKLYNDPVREFCDEILTQLVWDLVPFQFLYDVYFNWSRHNRPSSIVQGKTKFTKDLLEVLKDYPDWMPPPKTADGRYSRFTALGHMNAPEPLIAQYDLNDWKNRNYTVGADINKICTFYPAPTDRYPGIIRTGSALANSITQKPQAGKAS